MSAPGQENKAGGTLQRLVRRWPQIWPALLVCTLVLVGWQAAVSSGLIPNYLMPTPIQMCQALAHDAALIAGHAQITLLESAIGLAAGVALGFAVAVLMDRFDTIYRAIKPLLTVSQTVPTIAVAPLLVIWFGTGILPKVLLVILTTFFPITVSLVSGFRSVDPDMTDLMRTMHASRWQIFWHVKLPSAAEQFFSGLRISATYAIVGAVIAEWLGGSAGLGVYMTRVRKSFSYDRLFAAILVIVACSLVLIALVDVLQRLTMPWKRSSGHGSSGNGSSGHTQANNPPTVSGRNAHGQQEQVQEQLQEQRHKLLQEQP